MKFFNISLAAIVLVTGSAHKLERHHHHHHGQPSVEKTLIQIGLRSSDDLMKVVNDKLSKASYLMEVKKVEESCDAECKAKCDEDADKHIRELKNPLVNITWNCKNNYDVYTTDYDPDHSHFDRISNDVMDVQRALNKIEALEKKKNTPWNWR